jgi:hypothetical protein
LEQLGAENGTKAIHQTVKSLLAIGCFFIVAVAEDWPEWRGKERIGVWNESGMLDKFLEKGLSGTMAHTSPCRLRGAGSGCGPGVCH